MIGGVVKTYQGTQIHVSGILTRVQMHTTRPVKNIFTTLQRMEDSNWNPTISGSAENGNVKAEGCGTVMILTKID